MQGAFSGAGSKQTAVQEALVAAIGTYESRIRFGLELFPSDTKSSSCSHACCVDDKPSVLPQPNALDNMSSLLLCSEQQGCQAASSPDSPSHKALSQVWAYYASRAKNLWGSDAQTSAYVLLITASEPSCSLESAMDASCGVAVTSANSLASLMDIPVVVLSVGYQADKTPNSCLVRISNQGSTSPMPGNLPRLQVPTSVSALQDAVTNLFAAVAQKSCTLGTKDSIPDQAGLKVSMGRTDIAQSESDGWSFDPANRFQIKLSGSACSTYLKSAPDTTVSAYYSCTLCAGSLACAP